MDKTSIRIFMLLLLAAAGFAGSGAARAEILDRVVAVVNGRIITRSDIQREREVMAVLQRGDPGDEVILEELVWRYLVEDQIAQFREIPVSEEEIDAELAQLQTSTGELPRGFRDILAREIRRARYFDLRFRQFIRVTDAEIQSYYDNEFTPQAERLGLDPVPPLDEVRALIESNVIDVKLNDEVTFWLTGIRRRTDIEIFP